VVNWEGLGLQRLVAWLRFLLPPIWCAGGAIIGGGGEAERDVPFGDGCIRIQESRGEDPCVNSSATQPGACSCIYAPLP